MYVGSHISIRNGYFSAAKTAHSIGASAFQYFPKNPRSLKVKNFDIDDAKQCAQFCMKHDIRSIAHTPYPTKLIPETKDEEELIVASVKNDLEIAEACNSVGIVVHFGTTKKLEPLEGYQKMIKMLDQILINWEGSTLLLIENNAGAGTEMGLTFEEMVQIRNLSDYPEKIGFCFDTCHAFASGLWDGDNWKDLLVRGMELDYFAHLKAIHFNNSKYPYASRKDRHASIINGHITKEQWQDFLSTPFIKEIPLILETPNDEPNIHENEIQFIKKWISTVKKD
ncbi:deoxyribonuclease IV [Alkalihalobacterium alkalinitrilicum]|uniref:deoxyribonuclease IV n=1 Tax=Alkalihalobacterium alkalinitrilicum TaxID=427920 RepID=UPI00099531B0|nr:deoxyribonuclease IV [Alkalihalobacterium alkalinitrilicum]